MSTNAEYAEMPIVKLRVEALARNQRCLERKLSEQFKLNWIPCFLLSMDPGMRWSALQSCGQSFCMEPMLLETHVLWSIKNILILLFRDALKCNRKASGQLKVHDWTYVMWT